MSILAFGPSNFLGPQSLILLLIVLVFFGAKRLPQLARAFGQSIREFQRGKDGSADPSEIEENQRK